MICLWKWYSAILRMSFVDKGLRNVMLDCDYLMYFFTITIKSNTYISLIMLPENDVSSIDTSTAIQGLSFKLLDYDQPDNLSSFLLVTQRTGLWSSDQGSDNVAHSSLTCWFHPVTMWCKWKWKHPLAPRCQSYDISIAMTQLYHHVGCPAACFRK